MRPSKILLVLLPAILLAMNIGQSLALDAPSMPDEQSLSACGIAQGFAAGAMFGAAVTAFTPGGQTAAAILGLTAVSLRVGMSVLC